MTTLQGEWKCLHHVLAETIKKMVYTPLARLLEGRSYVLGVNM